jgi:2-polyprenyl-6-methoxyphenol hydroxylase-like FAD-dependent oxidoreductase
MHMQNKMKGIDKLECDLAIVGGGIAGPALAASLADDGYKILLVERSGEPLDTARGDHLQPVACEWLERWGVLDDMWARGAEKRLGSIWKMADGQPFMHAPVDNLPIPHPYFLYLNHEKISEVLLARAAQNDNLTIVRPGTARIIPDTTSSRQHGLILEHEDGETQVQAKCIAVADGRTSRGRKALGIEASTHHYDNPLLILFAPRVFADPRSDVHVYLTNAGIVSVVPRNGDQWKIGFPVNRDALSDWTKATPNELSRRLSALVPALDGIRPQVAGVYPVAMVNAASWSHGNCILLGDACHALHPGRSQGMNVALRGVDMLSTRLRAGDLAAAGESIPELLADFEAEFRPPIDARLDENHARGLDMDRMDPTSVERTHAAMSAIANSPEKLHRYCMSGAGY